MKIEPEAVHGLYFQVGLQNFVYLVLGASNRGIALSGEGKKQQKWANEQLLSKFRVTKSWARKLKILPVVVLDPSYLPVAPNQVFITHPWKSKRFPLPEGAKISHFWAWVRLPSGAERLRGEVKRQKLNQQLYLARSARLYSQIEFALHTGWHIGG